VRFVEAGRGVHSLIASTHKRRGHVRFQPADGRAGRREIVALVEQDGAPRATLQAGSYRAPAAPRPARPKHVRITRHGSRVRVSWRAPRPGFRHAVHLAIDDGRQLVRIARAGSHSVKVGGVDPGYGVAAKVIGLTSANGRGPTARTSIAGAAPKPARGRWKIAPAFDYADGGKFTLRHGRVSRLRVVPGAAADDGCGSGAVRMKGKRRLKRSSQAGRAVWIVGKRAPRTLDGARAVRVKVVQAGDARGARLKLAFDGRRKGVGELTFSSCRLYFESRR